MTELRQQIEKATRPADKALVLRGPGGVQCLACAHRCHVAEGQSGICGVRHCRGGELRVPWGYVSAAQVEPLAKKPFYHVRPGRDALTFGMLGCSFRCSFCQNWFTSQALRDPRAQAVPLACPPEELAELALAHNAAAMISSYNEPLITTEWALDVFRAARGHGLLFGYVSNGFATPEVLRHLAGLVDLYKVDLKAFTEAHYRRLGGRLRTVLEAIEQIRQQGIWLEVVTLVVPGFNDSDGELRGIARFLAGLSPDIPWHVTPFQPDYRLNKAAGHTCRTPPETLLRARRLGLEAGLHFVYAGNLPGQVGDAEHTRCPHCGRIVVERLGFRILRVNLDGGCCSGCGRAVPGIWGQ